MSDGAADRGPASETLHKTESGHCELAFGHQLLSRIGALSVRSRFEII